MDWLNECTSGENLPNGLYRAQIGIASRAVRLDGYLREIASAWQQGDADLPHLVSQAPIGVGTADSGRRRLYPVVGDLSRYMEIGAPLIKPAGSWVSVGFSGATRTGNRITWSRPQANLSIVHGGHFCKLDIELLGGYVPPSGQFAFPVSLVGLTRSGARILADGQTVMLIRPPVVYDAANPENVKPIDWQFGAIGGQTGVLFTLPSLTGMARPVVDPTLALQPAAAAGMDASITDNVATRNYGTYPTIEVGEWNGGAQVTRTLIKFDLSAIPSSAVISTATLSLYPTADYSSNARTFRVYRQKRAWLEGTRNGAEDNPATGATWNRYDTTNNWSTAGGFHADDCEQTAIGSCDFTATETLAVAKSFILTPTSKAALDLGNGWLIKADTEANDMYSFDSSDSVTAAQRPTLTLTYSLPGGGIGRGRSTLCREGRNRWL